jgi:hypothetical protein
VTNDCARAASELIEAQASSQLPCAPHARTSARHERLTAHSGQHPALIPRVVLEGRIRPEVTTDLQPILIGIATSRIATSTGWFRARSSAAAPSAPSSLDVARSAARFRCSARNIWTQRVGRYPGCTRRRMIPALPELTPAGPKRSRHRGLNRRGGRATR